jgi:copper chaperone NosL
MTKQTVFVVTFSLSLIAIFLMGCSPSANPNEPPEILYGQDVCEECGMIINEERFAASYMTEADVVRRFDDVGGMLLYDHKHQEDVRHYWVHDLATEEWIDAKEAVFVLDEGLITPMGWGLAPFATPEQAEIYIADNGGIMTDFATLQQEIADGTLDPTTLSTHQHEEEDGMEMEEDIDHEDNGDK